MSLRATEPEVIAQWQTFAFIARSFLPSSWLCFSLTYSRGNFREFLTKWQIPLAAALLLPVGIALGFADDLVHAVATTEPSQVWKLTFDTPAKLLNGLLLVAMVLILTNLEQTFRSSVGTMRWRIKFMILGLAIIFGARIYTRSQALVFSGDDLALSGVEAIALLIGCVLISVAYLRRGFSEIDVYPSRAVLYSSVTVLLAGGYLFVVGVLAQVIKLLGGTGNFQAQAFLVLLGIVVLSIMLLSDRLRQKLQRFISRNFKRPQHDFRKVWTLFTQCTSTVLNQNGLCTEAANLISKTFNVLSVTILLIDEQKQRLVLSASTSAELDRDATDSNPALAAAGSIFTNLQSHSLPFNLDKLKDEWAEALRMVCSAQFRSGGSRLCIPLVTGDRWLGVAVLADRVNGVPYTEEELDLLKCIGDQVAAALLNLRLNQDLMQAKELEAFQTMSTFFVHDLKNAASTLNLMLKNLPVHFDDPEFRQDALRGIGNTVNRIDQLIGRLSALRQKIELKPVESDPIQLVNEALRNLNGITDVEMVKELNPVAKVMVDREQFQSVITNLIMNAREAVGKGGRIKVETSQQDNRAIVSVTDNGCGMSPAFIRDSLFRPFNTTKKKGLGIGMFQSKMIVEAHRGSIQVESEVGKGTTFRVSLPLQPQV